MTLCEDVNSCNFSGCQIWTLVPTRSTVGWVPEAEDEISVGVQVQREFIVQQFACLNAMYFMHRHDKEVLY